MNYPRSPVVYTFRSFTEQYGRRTGTLEPLKAAQQKAGSPWEIMVRVACQNPDTLPIGLFQDFDGGIEGVPEVVYWKESYLEGKTFGKFLKDYRAAYHLREIGYRWATVAETVLFAAVTPRASSAAFVTHSPELDGWRGPPGRTIRAVCVTHAADVTIQLSSMDYLTPDTKMLAMKVR